MSFGLAALVGLVLGVVVAEAVILPLTLIAGVSGPGMDLFAFVWGCLCGCGGVFFAIERWT
jgi:hypothetical protein